MVTVVIYLVLCFLLTNCTATLAHRSASVTAAFSCWNRSQSGNWLCSAVFTSSLSSDTSVNKHRERELSQPLQIWLEGKSQCLDESLFHRYSEKCFNRAKKVSREVGRERFSNHPIYSRGSHAKSGVKLTACYWVVYQVHGCFDYSTSCNVKQ